ncbi:sigma-70 family RNA polymerase sigma factor [Nocardioides sp.]|uniref:RNA polymerase sigma factor n=1 Tax=Nocardioides sp. TaxID=35761 RepID=UPI002B2678B5|nr:sigma-70 family RNA polymerase sigma factor [Nocardioides sp.]
MDWSSPTEKREGHEIETPTLEHLVHRARSGDQSAWDDVVERFLPLVGSVISRHRLHGADAEDVNQTVWLRLVEHLDDLREPAALPGWIATTTRRECLRTLDRSRRTSPSDPQESRVLETADDAFGGSVPQDLDAGLLSAELLHALRDGLASLPEARRELLLLLLHDPPIPYQQISALLGIPVGSIGPTRARALEQLRHTPALKLLDSPATTTSDHRSTS